MGKEIGDFIRSAFLSIGNSGDYTCCFEHVRDRGKNVLPGKMGHDLWDYGTLPLADFVDLKSSKSENHLCIAVCTGFWGSSGR